MSLPRLEFLEVMIINACNLSCAGCTTFSDLQHRGYVTWDQGYHWLRPWTERVEIDAIGIMGGEPLMHPDLESWLVGLRGLLPNAQIRLVTNGLLLRKKPQLIDLLDSLGNCVFKISVHTNRSVLQTFIDDIMQRRNWTAIREYGIDRWVSDTGLRFQINQPKKFLQTFQGTYQNMRPHDSDPAQAFEVCVQKRCPMLHDGYLYKCGTAALTRDLLKRLESKNLELWQPYVHQGLSPHCDNTVLEKFIENFGKPHAICRQCPTKRDESSFFDHLATVNFK